MNGLALAEGIRCPELGVVVCEVGAGSDGGRDIGDERCLIEPDAGGSSGGGGG